MRWATADKDNKLKIAADVGKAKLTSECFTANGLTAVQPFQLTTDTRPAQRIKNLKQENAIQDKSKNVSPRHEIRSPVSSKKKTKIQAVRKSP